ncbi:MAG: carbamoyltransferase HypF [Pirellulales bacterium]|nr:carbamoyltransferase HypF [Pirellulales bacterium]
MAENDRHSSQVRRAAITVGGVVQGVGFRPFVYNLARSQRLGGWVRNEADTVQIDVQGTPGAVEAFLTALRNVPPPQARIDRLEVRELPCLDAQPAEFEIRPSFGRSAPQPVIPADLATCPECVQEIFDPAQRRHLYPFTNCTNCGPRWSIIERLPYDRPQTAMKTFAMCPACRAEYEDPADRRFHAQPIACPRCGPQLELADPQGRIISRTSGQPVLQQAAEALREGKILGLKGLGGFQILVDATDPEAVERLRTRKRRPHRPLAVMMSSLEEVRRHCRVSADEAQVLTSPQTPIVLLTRKETLEENRPVPHTHPSAFIPHPSFPLPDAIAPGNPYLGVMLPYTPLHHLLLHLVGRPVVCTSGNLSEEPMATDNAEALERLGPMVDLLLWHDRPIVRPVDDSVVRLGPAGLEILRRARGYAPLPLALDLPAPPLLALGGHLKNTVAVSLDSRVRETHQTPVVLSSHVGDLDHPLSVEVFRRAAEDLQEFYQVRPAAVVCDLHPDYASTHEAEVLARRWETPCLRVQHHHAHVAACMAEHGLAGPVLGLAWDGTGYGPDGTVWGGEFLVCEGSDYRRVAHFRTFPLPGGDRAVRQPRRSALGLLFEMSPEEAADAVKVLFSPDELKTLLQMLTRKTNCPRTSSVGRLFDAVAALCGLPPVITFEGQAAMTLEFAAEPSDAMPYSLAVQTAGVPWPRSCGHAEEPHASDMPTASVGMAPVILDWEPMLRAILEDRRAGVPIGVISARFHRTLAQGAVEIAKIVNLPRIVLSGGCFQNALLLRTMIDALQTAGFTVYAHQKVPPGDGGIALGQLYVAAMSYNERNLTPIP